MSKFCFFTDADETGLLNLQNSSDAFGVVSDTEFRVTSLHTAASNPRVFAVCDGTIAVQQDSQSGIVSLILKPKDQPPVGNKINFVPIKYIIYKGVVKGSLISGSGVADKSNNQLTSRAHATQDVMNRAVELVTGVPVNSIQLTPSLSLLGYNTAGNDNESLDKSFYKQNNSSFWLLSVKAGDYIGTFDKNLFGLEIVLDDVRAKANFILTRDIETKLPAVATAANDSQLFKRRHQKEAAISFMDPCAFFGSFFQYGGLLQKPVKLRYRLSSDTIDVEKETKDSDLHKAEGTEIYKKILVHFANKNAVYIDIRNELNTSLNFYQHYDNNVRLKIPQADDETIDKDYYGNHGWPLLVLRPVDFDLHAQNKDSDKDVIKVEIALPNPYEENSSPLVYLSQGYTKKIRRNKVLRGEKRYIPLSTSDDYTESFSVAIANISGEPKITPVSQYIRIKYIKAVPQGASSGIVPRASNYLDLLFLPFLMEIPFAITANSKSRVYQEDAFLGLSEESGCVSAGTVGIAKDTENTTLFAYAGDKLSTMGTTRLQTISLASEIATEPHYLNLVKDRYKREQLVQGKISVGALPYPSYLRFVDKTPEAGSDLSDANLRNEFIAVLINKNNFVEMTLDHGFSLDYDIFLRFTNEFQDADSAGVAYTRYDLVLEGYIDDGTSISLGTFDTGVKVYSFGKDHNLILRDKDAEYDSSTPNDVLPQCVGAFSEEELTYLRDFTQALPTAPAPFKDLDEKVFFINQNPNNKIEVKLVAGKYELVNPFTDTSLPPPPAKELPKGFLAEACTIFILYKLDKQLAFDTAADKQNIDIDHPDKSPIYKALKNILREAFDKPAPGADTILFNEMMQPDNNIGVRGSAFLNKPTSTKKKMYEYFSDKNPALSEDEIIIKINYLLKKFGDVIKQFVEDESACAYKILSGESVAPKNLFMATGDGSPTNGLLEAVGAQTVPQKTGVLLFNYKYDNTAGVLNKAEETFPSLNTNLSTAVHLTIFGLDSFTDQNGQIIQNSDSTVKVIKDGITYVFTANFTNKILSPVNGSEDKDEATYSATDNLFYKETTSVRRPLANYNAAKRDLEFIEKQKNYSFKVEVESFHHPDAPADDGYDEVAVSINVVEGPEIKQFEFEAEKLFESDVFVLDDTQKDNLLAAQRYTEPLEFMIDRLINVLNIPIRIDLRGNFIGKYLDPEERTTGSKVDKDYRYQFNLNASDREKEVKDEDEVKFPRLKYSFGSVIITTFNIIITIDSFVSPQWSRLDEKVPPGKQSQLDLLTNYHTIPGSDAYIEPPSDFNPTDINLPKMPSYNPILSGLRSFGLAEALIDILVKRATQSGKYDAFDIQAMKVYLEGKLANARVLKDVRLGIGEDIKFSDYEDFKP